MLKEHWGDGPKSRKNQLEDRPEYVLDTPAGEDLSRRAELFGREGLYMELLRLKIIYRDLLDSYPFLSSKDFQYEYLDGKDSDAVDTLKRNLTGQVDKIIEHLHRHSQITGDATIEIENLLQTIRINLQHNDMEKVSRNMQNLHQYLIGQLDVIELITGRNRENAETRKILGL